MLPSEGMLGAPLRALNDPEGASLPDDLPPVVDAHVHLFPDRLFDAIWRWFDTHAWPIRYRLRADEVVAFQRARGVEHMIALTYSHKPGMARSLNAWLAQGWAADPAVTPLGTVLPGEPDAAAIVGEAFDLGLGGIKLHCHVQCFAPDDPVVAEVYQACADAGRPLVMHAGREPKSPAYRCDPHELCSVERIDEVLRNHPALKLVIPHLGADEFEAYAALLGQHENLWLDTTMAISGFFPGQAQPDLPALLDAHLHRILYGTDFPNLPFAWDRELSRLLRMGLPDLALEAVLGGTAKALFSVSTLPAGC